MTSPERISSGEIKFAASEAAAEQAEKLRSKLEKAGEQSPEKSSAERADNARRETESIFAKEHGSENRSGGEPTASPAVIRKITKREKARAYKQTLNRIQSEMSIPARTFSKIIHAPIIEKSSEVIGSTAARPNALLIGAVTALILLSIVYMIGRTYGYRLSGFEMISAYSLGYLLGLSIDIIMTMFSKKRTSW